MNSNNNTEAKSRGLTPAQVALAWLLAKKEWIVPIPGTTKLAHLQENIASADIAITEEEWKTLEDTIFKNKDSRRPLSCRPAKASK